MLDESGIQADSPKTGETRVDAVAENPDWLKEASGSKRRRIVIVAVVAAVALVLVLARLASSDSGKLTTVTVGRGSIERRLLLEGRAKPAQTYSLSFPVPSSDDNVGPTIEEVLVKAGDHVGTGQILVRLEGDRVESALIRSPTDGVVVEVRGAAGAPPPTGAVVVVRTQELIAEFDLTESNLVELREGMEATLTVPVLSRSVPVILGQLPQDPKSSGGVLGSGLGSAQGGGSQSGTGEALNYALQIPLPQLEGVRPGMTVVLDVLVGSKAEVLVVPQETLRYDEQGAYVEVLEGRDVKPVHIQTGLTDEKSVEVVSGLSGGEEVVVRVTSNS
jgi:multidrug efflux pump subunit AcrA (membrane-fusion protein)